MIRSTDRASLAVIFTLLVISRLPFLASGYGSDPDAWRVAFASQTLWKSGEYVVSRFPGYPLHEIAMAPIVAMGGALSANVFTVLAFIAATGLWYVWSRRHARYPLLLTIAFAFFPLGWVASITTMDYTWSLLFLVASMLAASRSRNVLAGVLLGLAAGFRPSNIVFAVVLVFLLRDAGKSSVRAVGSMCLASIVTLLVAYLPVFVTYGIGGWLHLTISQVGNVREPALDGLLLASYRAIYAFGPLAVLTLIVLIIQRRGDLIQLLRLPDNKLLGAIVGCLVFGLTFLLLPAERSYVLPAILCVLIIVDRLAQHRAVLVFAFLLISYGFVNPDLVTHGGRRGVPGFNLRQGIVLEEIEKRRFLLRRREFLTTADLGDTTLIMVGSSAPVWVDNDRFETKQGAHSSVLHEFDKADMADQPARRTDKQSLYIVSVLSRADIQRARSAGFSVDCLEDVKAYAEWVGGFECDQDSVRVIRTSEFWQ